MPNMSNAMPIFNPEVVVNRCQAEAIVRGENLTKRFANNIAIDNVDIEIRPGEIIALLGPNGAGKTTLTNLLLGRLQPEDGSCQVFKDNPRKIPVRHRIGAMLQVSNVPPTLTVSEHIKCFSRYYPNAMSHEETIKKAGLTGLENSRFGKLSGGQKQRLLFALAICGNPDLLFLDEPTVGLDVEARRQFWEVICELRKQGTSVLLTTHYLEEADALADYIYVLAKGRVVAQGTSALIKKQVAGRSIRCATQLPVELLQKIEEVVSVSFSGKHLEIRSHDVEKTLRFMLSRDEKLSDLTVIDGGLEQAFLNIVDSNNGNQNTGVEEIKA